MSGPQVGLHAVLLWGYSEWLFVHVHCHKHWWYYVLVLNLFLSFGAQRHSWNWVCCDVWRCKLGVWGGFTFHFYDWIGLEFFISHRDRRKNIVLPANSKMTRLCLIKWLLVTEGANMQPSVSNGAHAGVGVHMCGHEITFLCFLFERCHKGISVPLIVRCLRQ